METDKLELKHLVGYLPYGLKALGNCNYHTIIGFKNETYFIEGGNNYAYGDIIDLKPILHPLSDLTKEIEVNGKKLVPLEYLQEKVFMCDIVDLNVLSTLTIAINCEEQFYIAFHDLKLMFEKLYEWHFDIHGLIEKGLAIDINTLNHGEK